MEWQAVSRESAVRVVAAGMRCALSGEGLRISAISECLRAASHLCSAPTDGHGAWEPAASIRLTSMVRRRLAPLWPDLADDQESAQQNVMEVLDSLSELGDMVRLEGGKWHVAPTHVVLADEKYAVLLGGGPIEALPNAAAASARAAGRIRIVGSSVCEGWTDPWDAQDWIGAPIEGLPAWSSRLLAQAAAQLTDAPSNMGDASAYLRREWVRLAELPAGEGGLLLFRAQVGYFVGEVVRGRLRRLSTIRTQDARRLRFHLDAQANCSIRVMATTSPELVTIRLARRLPEREARVLLLGWQIPSPQGEHPGVTYHTFPVETLPIVRKALEGLGIILQERYGAIGGNL